MPQKIQQNKHSILHNILHSAVCKHKVHRTAPCGIDDKFNLCTKAKRGCMSPHHLSADAVLWLQNGGLMRNFAWQGRGRTGRSFIGLFQGLGIITQVPGGGVTHRTHTRLTLGRHQALTRAPLVFLWSLYMATPHSIVFTTMSFTRDFGSPRETHVLWEGSATEPRHDTVKVDTTGGVPDIRAT